MTEPFITGGKDLFLLIDMQQVYMPGEPWACPGMPFAWENQKRLLTSGTVDPVFTVFLAENEPVGTWQNYNRAYAEVNADPRLSLLTKEAASFASHAKVYAKSTYSSLEIPQVRTLAEAAARDGRSILIGGVVAECCILSTLMALIDTGAPVIYLTDCIAGQTPENEETVRRIAESFAPVHVQVMTSDDYLSKHNPDM